MTPPRQLLTVLRLAEPWITLILVWEYGLHWAALIFAGLFAAGLLFAIGVVVGEDRRGH